MQNEILDYDEKKVTELVLKIDDVLHFFKEELNNGITEDSRKLCLKNMLSYVKETMIELGGRADLSDYEDILRNTIQERNSKQQHKNSQNKMFKRITALMFKIS